MAQVTNGTVRSDTQWYSTFFVNWSRTSYSVENNTSNIYWEAGLITTGNVYWLVNAVKINSIYIDGNLVLSGQTYSNIKTNGTHVLASGNITLKHDSNGDKSFGVSISGWLYDTGSPSGSGTFELPTIPRASSITVTDANIESSISIIIAKKVNSYTHTITYAFGSLTGTIATKTTDSTIGFTLPTTFYSQIPNAKSGTGTIYCTTYSSSGTKIGDTQSATFTATASESKCKPTISITAVDGNSTTKALTGDENKFIKYFSNASTTLTVTAKNSATISSKRIQCGDGKLSGSPSATFNNVESANFTGTVTDSRGYSNSVTLNKTLINYIKLTCNVEMYRPEPTTGEVYLKANGNYFNSSFGSVANTITLRYRYKESTSSTWGSWATITATKSGNTYSYNGSLGTKYDYTKSYNFQINAYDKLMSLTVNKTVSQGIPVFDWGENDFQFNVPVYDEFKTQYDNGLAVYNNGEIDPNETLESLILTKHSNSPMMGDFWYIRTNFYNTKGATSHRTQMAIPYQFPHNGVYIRVYHSGVWGNWRKTSEELITLYDNTSGTSGTVTLSETSANFSYLEVFIKFTSGMQCIKSVKVHSPNSKNFQESFLISSNNSATTYYKRWVISGTSVTPLEGKWTVFSSTGDYGDIYITKVVGYR